MDYELILVGKKAYTENAIGDSIPDEENKAILCEVKSVTRSEHYASAANGLRPDIIFVVNKYEYNGESEVSFNDTRYKVIRTYAPVKYKGVSDFETIELICQGIVNGVV